MAITLVLNSACALFLGVFLSQTISRLLEKRCNQASLVRSFERIVQNPGTSVALRKSEKSTERRARSLGLFLIPGNELLVKMGKNIFNVLKYSHSKSYRALKLCYPEQELAIAFLKASALWIGISLVALALGHWYLSPVLLVITLFVLGASLSKKADVHVQSFRYQFISFSETTASALGAGLSLIQGFRLASNEVEEPLRTFTNLLFKEVALGSPADKAFAFCAHQFGGSELISLSSSLCVQYRLGGNIKKLFEEHAAQARSQILFIQSLKAQTAQGRLSTKLVGIVPLILLGIMGFLMPGYFDYFFSSSAGQTLFALAILLNIFGFLLVSRLCKVRF